MEARPPDTRWRFVAPWRLKPKPAQKPEPKITRVKKMKSVKKPMNKKKAKSDSDEDTCLWSAGSRIVRDPSGAKCKITGGECLYRHTPKIVRKVVSRITSLDKDLSSPLDFEPPDEDTSDESRTIETFNLQRVNPVAHSFKKREEEIIIEIEAAGGSLLVQRKTQRTVFGEPNSDGSKTFMETYWPQKLATGDGIS